MPILDARSAGSEDDFHGKPRPVPGRYHAAINAAEEIQSKLKATPGLKIEFQIIADGLPPSGKGCTSDQSGKTIPLTLYYVGGDEEKTATCLSHVARLAMAAGVLLPGESREVDWNEAIGRELIIEIGEELFGDKREKKGSCVTYMGFWSLGNKAVKNVPRDTTSPGMQSLSRGEVKGQKPPTTTDGNTEKKSKYSDL